MFRGEILFLLYVWNKRFWAQQNLRYNNKNLAGDNALEMLPWLRAWYIRNAHKRGKKRLATLAREIREVLGSLRLTHHFRNLGGMLWNLLWGVVCRLQFYRDPYIIEVSTSLFQELGSVSQLSNLSTSNCLANARRIKALTTVSANNPTVVLSFDYIQI